MRLNSITITSLLAFLMLACGAESLPQSNEVFKIEASFPSGAYPPGSTVVVAEFHLTKGEKEFRLIGAGVKRFTPAIIPFSHLVVLDGSGASIGHTKRTKDTEIEVSLEEYPLEAGTTSFVLQGMIPQDMAAGVYTIDVTFRGKVMLQDVNPLSNHRFQTQVVVSLP